MSRGFCAVFVLVFSILALSSIDSIAQTQPDAMRVWASLPKLKENPTAQDCAKLGEGWNQSIADIRRQHSACLAAAGTSPKPGANCSVAACEGLHALLNAGSQGSVAEYRRRQQGECRKRAEAGAARQRAAVEGFRSSPVFGGIQEEFSRIDRNVAARERQIVVDTHRDFDADRARLSSREVAAQARMRNDLDEYYRHLRNRGPSVTEREIMNHYETIRDEVLDGIKTPALTIAKTALADGMGDPPEWYRTIDENPEASAAVENRVRLERLMDNEMDRWPSRWEQRSYPNPQPEPPAWVPGRR